MSKSTTARRMNEKKPLPLPQSGHSAGPRNQYPIGATRQRWRRPGVVPLVCNYPRNREARHRPIRTTTLRPNKRSEMRTVEKTRTAANRRVCKLKHRLIYDVVRKWTNKRRSYEPLVSHYIGSTRQMIRVYYNKYIIHLFLGELAQHYLVDEGRTSRPPHWEDTVPRPTTIWPAGTPGPWSWDQCSTSVWRLANPVLRAQP